MRGDPQVVEAHGLGSLPIGKCATDCERPNHVNDQQPQYDCSKVCFYVGPTTSGPRVSFPQVPLAHTFKRRVPRPDCVIYRDKPLPRGAFRRTAQQGPPVWLPSRSAPPENVWFPVTQRRPRPFHYAKVGPSTWVLAAKALALGALLLCFLPRKATETCSGPSPTRT